MYRMCADGFQTSKNVSSPRSSKAAIFSLLFILKTSSESRQKFNLTDFSCGMDRQQLVCRINECIEDKKN